MSKRTALPTRLKPNETLRRFLQEVNGNEWYPFVSEVEFEIARFVIENGLSTRAAFDLFTITKIGRSDEEFQLKNIHHLRDRLKLVPKEKWEIKKLQDPRDPTSQVEFYFKDVRTFFWFSIFFFFFFCLLLPFFPFFFFPFFFFFFFSFSFIFSQIGFFVIYRVGESCRRCSATQNLKASGTSNSSSGGMRRGTGSMALSVPAFFSSIYRYLESQRFAIPLLP